MKHLVAFKPVQTGYHCGCSGHGPGQCIDAPCTTFCSTPLFDLLERSLPFTALPSKRFALQADSKGGLRHAA